MKTLLELICEGDHFKLNRLPMSPSHNHQYWHQVMPGKSGGHHARPTPTGELKKFQKELGTTWKDQNLVAVYKARALCREWMLKGKFIGIYTMACFNYFDLFTSEGVPKRHDVSNRIKALHDTLAEVLEVDDSWFWEPCCRKVEIKGTDPWCAVILYPVEHLSIADMKDRGIV